MVRRSKFLAALLLVCGPAACSTEASSDVEPSSERMFVETLGVDTIAVESFTRTDSSIVGQVVSRNPVTTLARYRADLDAEGRIARFAASWHTGESLDVPSSRATITSDGRTARIIRTQAEATDTVEVELEATLVPTVGRLPLAVGLIDYATRRAAAEGADTMGIVMLWPLRGRAAPNAVAARGAGLYSLDTFGSPLLITVGEGGGVEAISGRETTNRVEIAPAAGLDLPALAADFAARDASGTGLGTPSPTDTATATIGGAELTVIYSRPAMRGRQIWGGLVPDDEVWRTGANAATLFTTSRPIRLGDLALPAGAYTLWSTYSPGGATLIVNSQTGQWGTAYDSAQDFGRTALEQRALDAPVERFTIELGPDGTPELRLVWADRMYVAPIVVR